MNKSARDHFCILPTPLLIVTLVIALSACTSDPSADSPAAVTDAINRPGNPDAYDVVDCLLPGQMTAPSAVVSSSSPIARITDRR